MPIEGARAQSSIEGDVVERGLCAVRRERLAGGADQPIDISTSVRSKRARRGRGATAALGDCAIRVVRRLVPRRQFETGLLLAKRRLSPYSTKRKRRPSPV